MVALIWIGILYLTEIPDITFIFPLLIFVDATSMAILMVGVTIFFEKQEGSLRAILVSPISKTDYLLSKVVVTVTSSVLTLIVLYIYALLFKDMNLSLIGLLSAVILVAFFHAQIGFILSYYSRDFTSLLVNMMKYLFIFFMPTLLVYTGIINHELFDKAVYLAPTTAAMTLLNASTGNVESGDLIYALAYLGIGSVILFVFVLRLFDSFAAREGGV
ncbi:MAG: ABC transporter permease [Bacillota bacterium]|nr:ABC transporter permease [Bacillota bacterium]